VLHETYGWNSLSIIGSISLWRILFRVHAGAIQAAQVVDFLKVLERHASQPMLIVWDVAPIHRSKLVTWHVASAKGRFMIERLPADAPELKPAEYIRVHPKEHEIANLLVKEAWQLSRQRLCGKCAGPPGGSVPADSFDGQAAGVSAIPRTPHCDGVQ
jgi:transposase